MNTYLVDTHVLLDVIGADAQFGPGSRDCLARCAGAGVLVINPVIYAEVGATIDTIEELDELPKHFQVAIEDPTERKVDDDA